MARAHQLTLTTFDALVRCCRWRARNQVVTLVSPLTMMNESGVAVSRARRHWRVKPEDMLIVYDDVNLPLGVLRLRAEGGDGGHHGLASCLDALGTKALPRLRVGVGVEPLPKELTDFVLGAFRPEERPVLDQVLDAAVEACEWWVREGIQAAMNHANPKPQHEGHA